MRRTTTRRRREFKSFCLQNRRLFPFVGLFLAGVALGVGLFLTLSPADGTWKNLLQVPAVTGGALSVLTAWAGRFFGGVGLLAALYLLGLWACGGPFILLVPLIYGLGLGLTEGYYYSLGQSGVLAVAAIVMPHGLLTASVLVTAASESLRLSGGLSRQLLPGRDSAEGLWGQFRLYSLRFLLFVAAMAAVSGLDILLRRLLGGQMLIN